MTPSSTEELRPRPQHSVVRTGAGARHRPLGCQDAGVAVIIRPRVQGEGAVSYCALIDFSSIAPLRKAASCRNRKRGPPPQPQSSSVSHRQAYECCRHIRRTEGSEKPRVAQQPGAPRWPGRPFPLASGVAANHEGLGLNDIRSRNARACVCVSSD